MINLQNTHKPTNFLILYVPCSHSVCNSLKFGNVAWHVYLKNMFLTSNILDPFGTWKTILAYTLNRMVFDP